MLEAVYFALELGHQIRDGLVRDRPLSPASSACPRLPDVVQDHVAAPACKELDLVRIDP